MRLRTLRRQGRIVRQTLPLCAASLLAVAAAARAESAVSLEEALRLARAANARLPVPSAEIAIARARLSEAEAARWFQVAVEGAFLYAPHDGTGYDPALSNFGEAKLQAVARQPIYAGGALRAGASRAEAAVEAAGARYRIAEKDLELDVRGRYFELWAAREEGRVRREGLDRLETYLAWLRGRQASGQAVAADVTKTEVRLALEQSGILDAEQREDGARIQLNQMMGRPADGPLEISSPEPPVAPAEDLASPWQSTPEIAEAEALRHSSEADLALARAERLPHLSFNADLGLWGSDTRHLNADFWDRLWHDRGYSLSLVLSWPVWDRGGMRARQSAAELGLAQSRLRVEMERRNAETQWSQARSTLRHLYRQIETLSRAAPLARDAYLETESRYRGGVATALEVLDAHAAATEAAVRLSEVTARYRVAEALARRWGEP